MRRIILMMSMSLDGYMAGPHGELEWHMVDEELHQHFNDQVSEMGGFLYGRVMYDLMARFWPTADADPSSSPTMVEFAGIWREMPKIVFSKTLERVEWNATLAREVVVEEIEALKAQPGGDLGVGGANLAASFMRDGLVDELKLYVHPVVIGRGEPLFPPSDLRTSFELVETRTFGNGVVLLRYQRP
jgi:dihydrofolate reductase